MSLAKDTNIVFSVKESEKTLQESLISSTLEEGDYIPFIEVVGITRKKHIHNYCNDKPFYIVTLTNMSNIVKYQEKLLEISEKFNVIVLSKTMGNAEEKKGLSPVILYTIDNQLIKMLVVTEAIRVYIASPNRRIKEIIDEKLFLQFLPYNMLNYLEVDVHIPYLKIKNVLDDKLLNKVIAFYNSQKLKNKTTSHNHATKNRLHVHPDKQLEKELDNKISRVVLAELKKVFYFDAQYRESYKICSYDSETQGRFHAHRDTPFPHQSRKYAMSLMLSDEYEGGELYLPEYNLKIKAEKNTAIIFPGISTHQVLEVTKGSRMAIITFFTTKEVPHYKFTSHFLNDNSIIESKIYPF